MTTALAHFNLDSSEQFRRNGGFLLWTIANFPALTTQVASPTEAQARLLRFAEDRMLTGAVDRVTACEEVARVVRDLNPRLGLMAAVLV